MSETFIVLDRLREIEFSGKKLGWSSTEKDESLRWTEIHIYKTNGGNYVIERLGQSLIYHVQGTECSQGHGYKIRGSNLSPESEPCPRCNPKVPEDSGFDAAQQFVHESRMSSAEVVERVDDLHDALSMYDRKRRVTRISHVAAQALQNAAANDPELLQSIIRKVHVK